MINTLADTATQISVLAAMNSLQSRKVAKHTNGLTANEVHRKHKIAEQRAKAKRAKKARNAQHKCH